MDTFVIPHGTRDITPEVMVAGRLQILDAAYWARTTPNERARFGMQHGIYNFPTAELVEHLRELIGDQAAIEVGAGNGVLAEALGIQATDSMQQENPQYRNYARALGQAPVRYGPNVIECDAVRAVRRFKPDVVLACWLTHKYRQSRPLAGGNAKGAVEEDIIAGCRRYIFVGNEAVHKHKSIWSLPHTIEYPDFVYSRAVNGSRDFIAIWPGGKS